jgi:hypothetical protein
MNAPGFGLQIYDYKRDRSTQTGIGALAEIIRSKIPDLSEILSMNKRTASARII